MLSFYYKNDSEVQQDSELQKWIQDINEHGLLFQKDTGRLTQNQSVIFNLVKLCFMSNFLRNSTEPQHRSGDGEVCHHGRLHVLGTALGRQRRTGNVVRTLVYKPLALVRHNNF